MTHDLTQTLLELQRTQNLPDSGMAYYLGIDQAEYQRIKIGEREPEYDELKLFAKNTETPLEAIFDQPENQEKFTQMILYLVKGLGSVPKTKLAKLLYLADFSSYYENLESMSGSTYIKMSYGPVPSNYFNTLRGLLVSNFLKITYRDFAQFITLQNPNFSINLLTEYDKTRLDELIEIWKDKSTNEIVEFTHNQIPWKSYSVNEQMSYVSILGQPPDAVIAPNC
jgi:uncharacterized phage-associated protein